MKETAPPLDAGDLWENSLQWRALLYRNLPSDSPLSITTPVDTVIWQWYIPPVHFCVLFPQAGFLFVLLYIRNDWRINLALAPCLIIVNIIQNLSYSQRYVQWIVFILIIHLHPHNHWQYTNTGSTPTQTSHTFNTFDTHYPPHSQRHTTI